MLTKLAPDDHLDPKWNLNALLRSFAIIQGAYGAPKSAFFWVQEIRFLAKKIFAVTARKCLLRVFRRFWAPKCPLFQIFELRQGFGEIRPVAILDRNCRNFFLGARIQKIPVSRRRSRWVYHLTWRVSIGLSLVGRNLIPKLGTLKIDTFYTVAPALVVQSQTPQGPKYSSGHGWP